MKKLKEILRNYYLSNYFAAIERRVPSLGAFFARGEGTRVPPASLRVMTICSNI